MASSLYFDLKIFNEHSKMYKKNHQLENELGSLSQQDNQTNLCSQFLDVLRISPGSIAKRNAEKRFTND